MSYTLPVDAGERPVVVIGAGTLGRRIAAVYAAGGSDVRIFDTSPEQAGAAREYVEQHTAEFARQLGLDTARHGQVALSDDLPEALARAWMVIEAVPERIDVKSVVFEALDKVAEADAILCSNSSSLPTSQMIAKVKRRERVLNTHYQMPPQFNAVELMSCGETDDAIIEALTGKLPEYGLVPVRVRRESDGFVFNRIWAAVKRECLMVVEEGVATPEDVDAMWQTFAAAGVPPFRLMDRVGLDIVLAIEEHYADVRPGIPEGPRKLLREYIDQGRLGTKSGRGFYDTPG